MTRASPLRACRGLIPATLCLCLAFGAASGAPSQPEPERDYIAMVDQARAEFAASRSVDARSAVRIAFQISLHRFMGLTHEAQDWTGFYQGGGAAQDGSRSIAIEIAPGIVIATWDSRFVDAPYGTMAPPSSLMARVLDGLTIGQPVVFSANLLGSVVGPDDDMVMRPRIVAKITRLAPLPETETPGR